MIDFRNMRGEADVAAYIGCSQQVVNRLLSDPPGVVFAVHEIPKRGRHGTFRRVLEVQGQDSADAFKALNRRLQSFIAATLPGFPHRSAHGYVPGRSTLSNARVHVGCPMILKLDIRDFFPSITLGHVRTLFLSLGLTDEAADALARFVTVEGRLALGLHTSPLIANAVCHGLDARLSQLVEPEGGRYSRYADDLTFSGARLPKRVDLVEELARDGFTIAEEKWRVVRCGRGLFVTGLSLEAGDRPRVPKEFKRRLRQELYYARRYGLVEHVGRRGYSSIESGVNKIHGRIQYLRGIERKLGDKLHEKWTVLLRECGQEVSYPGCRANPVRTVLFCIDESEIDAAEGPVLAVALVAIEDREVVSAKLREFREQVHAEPFVTTEASVLDAEGLHYNRLSEDVRTRIVTLVAGLPARVFVAYERLATCEKSEYSATYLRLFESVLERRLLLYNGCDVEVAIEQNSKITREHLQSVVTRIYRRLVEMGSRRPTAEPKAKVVSKQDEESIALPDVFLGVFGAFATAPQSTAQERGETKKRKSGNQAMLRFEQLRDKFRMIKSVDSGEVFSRRQPFQPWSASRLAVSRGTAPVAYRPLGEVQALTQAYAQAAILPTRITQQGGVELVLIPGGVFLMGSPASERGRADWEGPQHNVTVEPFYLGRYPVTNEEYARFMQANADAKEPAYWANRKFNQTRQPVVGVSWHEAQRFAEWAGGRLPTEAEWEYAARAGTTTRYWWGNQVGTNNANCYGCGSQWGGKQTSPVGSFQPNAFGLHDLLGNVWEWVGDCWHENYEGAPTDGSTWGGEHGGDCARRVIRGGFWFYRPRYVRSAYRNGGSPDNRNLSLGFRLAQDI